MGSGFSRALLAAGALVGLLGLATTAARAQVNVAAGKPVVGGSGSWNGGTPNQGNPYNVGQFSAQNVTDYAPGAIGGPGTVQIPEPDQANGDANGGFWLGKEQDLVEDFVLDLLAPTALGQIELFNTHNGTFNDRMTGAFEIHASNTVAARSTGENGEGGVDLVGPVLIASGTLTGQTFANDPIEGETFAITDNTPYRYIRFRTLGPIPGTGNVGLNEIRVFEIPEPATAALFGLGVGGLLLRRRSRRA